MVEPSLSVSGVDGGSHVLPEIDLAGWWAHGAPESWRYSMLPGFLIPETVTTQNGASAVIELGAVSGTKLLLTLGITRIIEQESLDVEVWGSVDGAAFGDRPLLSFPQKFYCGTYSMELDLARCPDVRHLRVDYKLNRWGRGDQKPLFGFWMFAEDAADVNLSEQRHAAVA
jgi:hypothetical protein